MLIALVMDNKHNWFYPRLTELAAKIRAQGHECVIVLSDPPGVAAGTDIAFYLGHEGYIGKTSRAKSKHNIVVHASDLPKGKGMSPATWQIIEGKNIIPVTLFEVAPGFDTGDYYLKDRVKLDGTELLEEWQSKLGECIERMMLRFIADSGRLRARKQRGRSTVYRRRTPADSELDVNRTLKSQFNLLRVADNERYPAYFRHKGRTYLLKVYGQP